MTQAIAARRDGDAFQARLFWFKAAKLLDDEKRILRVGFENGPKGFDDIWVEYDPNHLPPDQFGMPMRKEYFQCKWHVAPGSFTHQDFIKPEFINAVSVSLLQRAHKAWNDEGASGLGIRFNFVTNWHLEKGDQLFGLLRNRSHTFHLPEFFSGTTQRSASFRVRQLWRDHLRIDDEVLRGLVGSLALPYFGQSLDSMREMLDTTFLAYGLQRVPTESSVDPYDDRVRQWAAQGRNVFDRDSFRDACAKEGILVSGSSKKMVFGVKSFEHPIDKLEDRCTRTLDLVPEFDDRLIRDSSSWNNDLLPRLTEFLKSAAQSGDRIRLALDAHATLAFAAGSVLNTKSGRVVELEQRSPAPVVWAPDDCEVDPSWPLFDYSTSGDQASTTDIAIGISLTHDVESKVRAYAANLPLPIKQFLFINPSCGPSHRVVQGGAHAALMAQTLAAHIKAHREGREATSEPVRIHLFIAAPNGFTFYFGRHSQSLKPFTLYEFDFENQAGGSYRPSLSMPEQAS